MPNQKFLALDVGDARIGVAVGSLLPSHAEPLATLKRAGGYAEQEILKLISERLIDTLIVGLPIAEDGSFNLQCSKIEKFCRRLQRRVSINIEFVDEYASSAEAEEYKSCQHGSDAVAAALILRRYLDGISSSKNIGV